MDIHKILERASTLRIAVVGDLILDRYIIGDVNRISPEAPVPVVHLTHTRENPGGAGNVAENLKGLGCQVSFFHQPNPPIKTRVMSGNHHLLRIDDEDEPIWVRWDDIDIGLGYGLENNKYDIVILSDYSKGMLSAEVIREVIGRCKTHDIPVVVDSKHKLGDFIEASLVKCNKKEWDRFTTKSPYQYLGEYFVDDIVITDGPNGMEGYNHSHYNVDGLKINLNDSCGAGDTVISVLAVMKALKYGLNESIILANIAGSAVCMHPGVTPITKELLIKRFNEVT